MNQRKAILKYLETHKKGMTSRDAIEKFGCTRLAAVVAVWRSKGYIIVSKRETVTGRYGNVSVARYFLVTEVE